MSSSSVISFNEFHDHIQSINLNQFPDELLLEIFEYLNVVERIRLRRVCTKWHRLTLFGIKLFFDYFASFSYVQAYSTDLFETKYNRRVYFNHNEIDQMCQVMCSLLKQLASSLIKIRLPENRALKYITSNTRM